MVRPIMKTNALLRSIILGVETVRQIGCFQVVTEDCN